MAFRRVTLPLLWPGIVAGLMLAFVISLDDVVITELVKSAGQDTLPDLHAGPAPPHRHARDERHLDGVSGLSIIVVTLFFFLLVRRTSPQTTRVRKQGETT